jgi:hypothetical protein
MIDGCGGWFDSQKKQFVCCMDNYLGLEILVHEYSHFLQWKNNKKYFNRLNKSTTMFFDWIDGEEYSQKEINSACEKSIELEYDCELQAIKLIKEYKLDIDLEVYIKAANSYLLFYNIVKEKRKWSTDKSAYNKLIMKLMPTVMFPLEFYQNADNISSGMRLQYEKIL